jgi:type IV pilus assembly protein PilM
MGNGFFLKFFPFPRYLQIPAVGIDISDRSIKYVELEKYGGGLKLKKFGKKNIDKGIVEKGEIKQKEDLIKSLGLLKQELANNYIIASLPEEKAFLKVVQLPFMEEYQVSKSLEVQIEEIVPFSPKEIVFDFDIIDKSVQKNKMQIALSAFSRKTAKDYAEVFQKAGFAPIAFEVESQSVFRLLVEPAFGEAVMVIDFGKTRTSFSVGEEGFVKFASTINVAGEHIDRALAKNLNLDIFEAEREKRKQVVRKTAQESVLTSVVPVISVIKDEARRIVTFWQTHTKEQGFKNKEISQIILCGGDSNMIGLTDYLAYELKIPVEIGNPWLNITDFEDHVPEIERNKSLMYVTALGLALRSFRI